MTYIKGMLDVAVENLIQRLFYVSPKSKNDIDEYEYEKMFFTLNPNKSILIDINYYYLIS